MSQEESIYLRAIAVDKADEREAFLRDACGEDRDLLQRIEKRVLSHIGAEGGDGRSTSLDGNDVPANCDLAEPGDSFVTLEQGTRQQERARGLSRHGAPPSSTWIGPYKLLQQIGEGGMGTVWMAEQEVPVRRRVALKLIKGPMASKQVVARFEAERQALAMMDHPSIARVLDAGTTETGNPYFVMELVRGIPITEYCDRNRLTPDERLRLFVPVCKAIQHAHQKGIIHRDLKPGNVLVQLFDGEPIAKVIDFGLAKALQHQTRLTDKTMFTEFGQVVGTVQYMSPEQATMDALSVDTRSDIYSLGVMLYELLAGSTPLSRDEVKEKGLFQVLEVIRAAEPPKPSHRLSSSADTLVAVSELRQIQPARLQQLLKGEVDWIVMKALEKDRSRRYETANDFAKDIENYLNGDAVCARPPTSAYRIRKFAQKNKRLVASFTAMLILLGAGITGTSLGFFSARQKAAEAIEQRAVADENAREAKAAQASADSARQSAEIKRQEVEKANELLAAESAFATFQLANARWDANRVEEARDELRSIPERHRNFEWYYSYRKFEGSDFTCYGHRRAVTGVAFSPDGESIVSGSLDGTLRVWNSTSGKEILKLNHGGDVTAVAYHPNGTQILSGGAASLLKSWDMETGAENLVFKPVPSEKDKGWEKVLAELASRQILGEAESDRQSSGMSTQSSEQQSDELQDSLDAINSVTYSKDGRLALTCGTTAIKLWDVAKGQEIRALGAGLYLNPSDVALFSPSEKFVVSAASVEGIKYWDAETGDAVEDASNFSKMSAAGLCFSPDGSRLAYCTLEDDRAAGSTTVQSNLRICDSYLREEKVSRRVDSKIASIDFDPSGTLIATGGEDGKVVIWEASTGQKVYELKGHTDAVTSLDFSPDGTRVVSGSKDHTLKVWDVRSADGATTLHSHRIYDGDLNSDGSLLVTGGNDRILRLWDIEHQKELATLEGHTRRVLSVSFNHEGSRIVSGGLDEIKTWDVAAKSELLSITNDAHLSQVDMNVVLDVEREGVGFTSVVFDSDESSIVSIGIDGQLRQWDASTGLGIKSVPAHEKETFFGSSWAFCSLLCGRNSLWTCGSDGKLKSWDPRDLRIVNEFNFGGSLSAVAVSQDASVAIVGVQGVESLMACDIRNGSIASGGMGVEEGARRIRLSSDGSRLVAGSLDGKLKVWDTKNWREMLTLEGHTEIIGCLAFTPDGSQLISASWDGTLRFWDAIPKLEASSLVGHTDTVGRVRFNVEGTRLYSEAGDERIVWDLSTTEPLPDADWEPREVEEATSRDGRWLAIPIERRVVLVDRYYKADARVRAGRESKSRFDAWWHRRQATQSMDREDWYAATFHFSCLAVETPEDEKVREQLKACHEQLKSSYKDERVDLELQLEPVMKDAIERISRGVPATP